MRRKLFLHIGSHRTATTSIQQFMHENLDRLEAQGILYPLRVARHQRLINKIFAGKLKSDEVAADLSRVADERKDPIKSIVLSDEDISIRDDLSALEGFKEHCDVKILFSMRRQDLWLESWYFQNIKWQWNKALSHCRFDEFMAQREAFHWIHYDRYVRMLENMFGAENILLSVFEKDQMPGGPVVNFCRQIGLTDLQGFSDPPHVNSSMSAEMVEFVRHMPLDQFEPPERDLLRRAFEAVDRTHLGNSGKQSELLMTPRQRRKLLSEYEVGNQAVAKRYFNRDALFLDPPPKSDRPLAKLQIPSDSATLINRIVAPLLVQLVESGTIKGKD